MSRIGRGPGAGRRWGSALGGTLVLATLPLAVAKLPVRVARVAPQELLERIRASTTTPYLGYAESSGRISLPDVSQLKQVFDLLGGTTKLRVWWRGPAEWRVDTINAIGEHGLYHDSRGTIAWDSYERRAVRVHGDPPVRLPRPSDLLPPELGRRLAAAARPERDRLTALPPHRVAGHAAPGVRIVPADPGTTVAQADIWADARTGLPVEVRLTAKGQRHPTIETRFLELALGTPAVKTTTFVIPPDADFGSQPAPDLLAAFDGYAPFLLPGSTHRGMATYGDGYGAATAVLVPDWIARRIYRALEDVPAQDVGDGRRVLTTPLLNALVVRNAASGLGLIVSGAVSVEVLKDIADRVAAGLVPE